MAHRVVVVGGGFAGLNAAKDLNHPSIDLTVVDRRNFHLFQPLLYQVATGTLAPGDIAAPLRSILRRQKNTKVLLAEVRDVDAERKVLLLDSGDELPYDSLILATGAENSYFGNDSWEHVAPGLKTIEDATRIRHKILYAFEAAEREDDPEERRAWLTFVVVGAGATGVELAGALAEIARNVLRDEFRSIKPEEARILLLDGSPRVLPPFEPGLSAKAERALIQLGVRPRNNVRVTAVEPESVTLKTAQGEERIRTRTILWAAGVKSSVLNQRLAERTGVKLDRAGRVEVSAELTVPSHPEIFVVGDTALVMDGEKPVPGVAPAAMQMGHYAAKVIKRRLEGKPVEPFRYWDKGSLAVIGRHSGVAHIGPFRFDGFVAWLCWLFIHLMYLVGFENRLIVFVRWGISYLTWNRMARLITGGTDESVPAVAPPSPVTEPTGLHKALAPEAKTSTSVTAAASELRATGPAVLK
jgi:NADH:ubiquinone reductase (H+-translocating)